MGVRSLVTATFLPPNRVDEDGAAWVSAYLAGEVAAGRMGGPFRRADAEAGGPVRAAPFFVIPKSTPGEFRLVENFSFGGNAARGEPALINSELDAQFRPCSWTSHAQLERFFCAAASRPTTTVMGLDFKSGFHHIPIAPRQRRHFCLSWDDGIFVRKVASFGGATTPGIFGQLVDASKLMLHDTFGARLRVVNQVDNLAVAFVDAALSETAVVRALHGLGLELNTAKTAPRSRTPTHNGITWNLDTLTMEVPAAKAEKYLGRVRALLKRGAKAPCGLDEWETLTGSLQYVAQVLKHHRPRLRVLYNFRKNYTLNNPYATHRVLERELRCLTEWEAILSAPSLRAGFSLPTRGFPLSLYSDACSSGLGIFACDPGDAHAPPYAAHWRFIDGWMATFDTWIFAGEAWGVEVAVDLAVALGAEQCALHILCDNTVVVQGWAKGWSGNPMTNASFARLFDTQRTHGLTIRLTYVESALNLADAPSRGELPPVRAVMPQVPAPMGTYRGCEPEAWTPAWKATRDARATGPAAADYLPFGEAISENDPYPPFP